MSEERLTGERLRDERLRTVEVTRTGLGVYQAVNGHGAKITFGQDNTQMFSAVELLLASIAGCSGTDVDFITSRRAEPESFNVHISGEKVRDHSGKNHVASISMTFDVRFPEGEAGDAARAVLERAVQQSHDRLCSVSQTVTRGTPVEVRVAASHVGSSAGDSP
jgi:putative redox protein